MVKTSSGKGFPLEVESFDTIEKIKTIIHKKEYLSYNDMQLEDCHKLSYYNIQDNSTIDLNYSFQIFVKTVMGNIITLRVELYDTIESVKNKIQEKESIPSNQQDLILSSIKLENDRTLFDYNIKNDTILYLILSPNDNIKISVVIYNDKNIILKIKSSDTVNDIKTRIQEKENISPEKQHLIYDGIQLRDHHLISHYKIKQDSIIQLEYSMQIFIQTFYGFIITLDVKPSDIIKNIKNKIHNTDFLPEELQLIFEGMQLDENCSISNYNIKQNSTIQLIFEIKIFICMSSGETFNIEVKSIDNIVNIKTKIHQRKGILSYFLYFSEIKLEDHLTINDYNIKQNSIVQLVLSITIYIKVLGGKIFTLDVNPLDTIGNIKIIIQQKEGIPQCQQRLVFCNKCLNDNFKLSDYNVQNQCSIHLVLRPHK